MRLKNIVLVLLVGILVLLVPETLEAAGGGSSFDYTYNCKCKGDYMTYYSDMINSPYLWTSVAHSLNSSTNTYTSCSFQSFCRVTNNMLGEYFIKILIEQSDGTIDLNVGYIYLSPNDTFEFYDVDGSTFTKNHNSYTGSNYGGISNGIYYGMWSYIHGSYPYNLNYDSGFNYVIECNSSNMKDKMHELAKYLCGETTELPSNVTVALQPPIYDLEAPLGVTVTSSDNSRNFQIYGDGLYQGSDLVIPYKVWWNQSNIDLTGYETEFHVREYGKYKKSLFSSWVDVMTPYIFDKSFVTAKYCNNSLKYYEFSPKDKKRIYQYCTDEAGEEPYAVEFYHPDFMLRNKKKDENGQMHYSNWVYVKTYDDGTYSVFEMEQEYDLEEDPDETGNIDVDSPNYDDEIIYEDTDYSPDIGGVKDSAKFITVLKDLANSLGDFPDLFAQIFSFLPSWVLVCIGTLFVVIMLKGIF